MRHVIMRSAGKDFAFTVLHNFCEFKKWYMDYSRIDTNICPDSEIQLMLLEEQPDAYPCIPMIHGDMFDVFYLSINLFSHVVKANH